MTKRVLFHGLIKSMILFQIELLPIGDDENKAATYEEAIISKGSHYRRYSASIDGAVIRNVILADALGDD